MKSSRFRLRFFVQLFFFVFVFGVTISKFIAKSGMIIPGLSTFSLHGICPFGGVETLYQLATTGTFVQKIHSSSVILMLLVFLSTLLFGSVFCSSICPLGSFQEWVGKLGKKLFKNNYNRIVPPKADRIMRYLRYAVLAWILYLTGTTGKLIFQSFDPFHALFNFFTGEVAVSAFLVLAAVTVLSLFVERPWCKYLCPFGAVLGVIGIFRLFPIRRHESTCINCGRCNRSCPMNIDVKNKRTVRNHQCISCYQCLSGEACPVDNTLTLELIGGSSHEN